MNSFSWEALNRRAKKLDKFQPKADKGDIWTQLMVQSDIMTASRENYELDQWINNRYEN